MKTHPLLSFGNYYTTERSFYRTTSSTDWKKSMTVVLYYMPHSPPCRSVMMVAKHLGVQFNLKFISIPQLEQLKPSFLEINPQHTVPTMDDNGFILWER
ncbi:hypothetical protein TSAR_013962 [Trichomalopsis sarcophagae]|uniref:GST N-terminal domain-containing protein n=1 Tax=Trichomalopsis sarcophagae TaxID=543379 RepID=A0A232FAY6_9HYME|nr:hypothetical protein TSAR_013962 [Trichomalopsis sarcophagae]